MKKSALSILLAATLVLLLSTVVHAAEIAVIVNKNNGNDVSREMVEKIYKGELTLWPGGADVLLGWADAHGRYVRWGARGT